MKRIVFPVIVVIVIGLPAVVYYFMNHSGNANDSATYSASDTTQADDGNMETVFANEYKTINIPVVYDLQPQLTCPKKHRLSETETGRKLYIILISQQICLPAD